jgi:hypothetical protein
VYLFFIVSAETGAVTGSYLSHFAASVNRDDPNDKVISWWFDGHDLGVALTSSTQKWPKPPSAEAFVGESVPTFLPGDRVRVEALKMERQKWRNSLWNLSREKPRRHFLASRQQTNSWKEGDSNEDQ